MECEASVVCGETHLVSCCGAVRGVRKPSALALKLMQQAKQVEGGGDINSKFAFGRQPPLVVVGEHARQLARDFGLETATENDEELDKYQVTDKAQQHWDKWRRRFQDAAETKTEEDEERFDTVGAICMDPRGTLQRRCPVAGWRSKCQVDWGSRAALGWGVMLQTLRRIPVARGRGVRVRTG